MRIATWNVNSVRSRLPRLLPWLAQTRPDVLCLQETKVAAGAFPADEIAELGYATAAHGDGRWNGVAILSRVGLSDVTLGFPGEPGFPRRAQPEPVFGEGEHASNSSAQAQPEPGLGGDEHAASSPEVEPRAIGASCDGVRVWSIYAPNGREPDSPHYAYKLSWFQALTAALRPEIAAAPQLAVCGDFNVAPTDDDVWDPAAFAGATHVTPAERDALARLRDAGLRDVVPTPMKGPRPYTYWDYRAGMFHKNMGMRIDLVYATPDLAQRVESAYVDREARKGKLPSDHAPIVVDLT